MGLFFILKMVLAKNCLNEGMVWRELVKFRICFRGKVPLRVHMFLRENGLTEGKVF